MIYNFDRIIIGAGIYGLYAAIKSLDMGYKVLVIDIEKEPFMRGSYVNQARLHNGYHYPRSYSTAEKSAHYFKRFYDDFRECINDNFEQVYAIASDYSWTNSKQFQIFCDNLSVTCDEIHKEKYFNSNTIEKAFLTHEYAFDSLLIKDKLFNEAKEKGCDFLLGNKISKITKNEKNGFFEINVDGMNYVAPFVLNATYAGTNQIHEMLGYAMLNIKYELCEVILCNVSNSIKNVGLTVMDGPFFSVMPFGKTGYHSITTVSRTPHVTCYKKLPTFDCQDENPDCSSEYTCNCNFCNYRPNTAFNDMLQIAKKYLNEDIKIDYVRSLFTLKPIVKASEIDDSRPTIIKKYSNKPDFYTVFSGKLNTMYDLDSIL